MAPVSPASFELVTGLNMRSSQDSSARRLDLQAIRVMHDGDALFELSSVDTDEKWKPRERSDDGEELLIERSIIGTNVQVELLEATDDGSAPRISCSHRRSPLFDGVLRVAENSAWIVRCPSAQSFRVSVTAAGHTDGLEHCGSKNARILSLRNAVGQLVLTCDGVSLPIIVLSTKLPLHPANDDPVAAIEELLRYVWERHLALVRRLGGPTSLPLGVGRRRGRSPLQTLMLLEHLLEVEGVADAWRALLAEPRSALQITWPSRPVELARRPALDGPRGPALLPGAFDPEGRLRRVRDRVPIRTPDTLPNRLAVRLAVRVEALASAIEQQLSGGWLGALGWRRRAREVRSLASQVRHHPALAGVSQTGELTLDAPVLRQDPLYRPLLRAWTQLDAGLALPPAVERLLHDPLREAFDLYEYACWFALCHIVNQAARESRDIRLEVPIEDPVLQVGKLAWSLRHDATLKDGRRVAVFYNTPAGANAPYSSYSVSFRPDLALTIDGPKPSVHLLDAKYRVDLDLDPGNDDAMEGLVKHDDLKVMHAYRDALRARTPHALGWALILFPGTKPVFYQADGGPGGPSPDAALLGRSGGVGALPFSPFSQAAPYLEEAVAQLLGLLQPPQLPG
ncbi:nuclease domain-containing protein [Sorangium sp. So ce385]|uniref:nuclease domain-containing protein n=1 Tax=Sorangium sp. So ce385 TaxID=3133308 RepID=UPI003F5B0839